jgi:thiopeptide-type bacteriocin biosynthesis protein
MYEPLDMVLARMPMQPSNHNYDAKKGLSNLEETAIAVASPSLFQSYKKKAEDPNVVDKLDSYLNRMSNRSTPFGLFSGVALAELGTETRLERAATFQTRTRADMTWFFHFVEKLEQMPAIRRKLRLYSHSNHFQGSKRFWVGTSFPGNQNLFVPANRVVTKILKAARNGAMWSTLVALVVRDFALSKETGETICEQLCNAGFLVSEVRFALTADKPTSVLEKLIDGIDDASSIRQTLASANLETAKWDRMPGKNANSYLHLHSKFTDSFTGGSCLQTDTSIGLTQNTISRNVAFEVAQAAQICMELSPEQNVLQEYQRAFSRSFQYGREIPILELLSEQFGLGSPYQLEYKLRTHKDYPQRESHLYKLALDTRANRKLTVKLTSTDLALLKCKTITENIAPPSLDMFATVVSNSQKDMDSGNFLVALSTRTGDIGAGRTLGRFAHILGEKALTQLAYIAEREQELSETLVADVAFSTTAPRFSNINAIPLFRKHIIVSGCVPSPDSINIPLQEIVIGVTSQNCFYARWLRTGQLITARSASLLGEALLPIPIRFLLDIAASNQSTLFQFHWGNSEHLPFLPGVIVGKTLIRPAQWNLQTLRELIQKREKIPFREILKEWMQEWNVPIKVLFAAKTNDESLLTLDFRQDMAIEKLQKYLKKKQNGGLLFDSLPADQWHQVKGDNFVTELVFSFVKKGESVFNSSQLKVVSSISEPPDYLLGPGSAWLYLKLECSPLFHNELIAEIGQKAEIFKAENIIDDWFFIRYYDQQHHLRIRFRVSPNALYTKLMPDLCAWGEALVSAKTCRKYSFETYDREFERYGGRLGMQLIEKFFGSDTETVVTLLSQAFRELNPLVISVLSINSILASFGMDNKTKLAWLKQYVYPGDKKESSTIFREVKKDLCALISEEIANPEQYSEVVACIQKREKHLANISKELQHVEGLGRLTESVWVISESLVHMHCNRLLGADRRMERIARTLLTNTLQSLLARR